MKIWTKESILSGVFVPASDVWSFGVVMFEIFSNGGDPYPGLNGEEVIASLKQSKYLAPASNMPDSMVKMMQSCFVKESERPTFSKLFEDISQVVDGNNLEEENEVEEEYLQVGEIIQYEQEWDKIYISVK